MVRVLLVDSDNEIMQTLKLHLAAEYLVECRHPNEALIAIENEKPDIILFCSEGILQNIDMLKNLTSEYKTIIVIKTASQARMHTLLDAGVTDWLTEPLNFEQLNWKLRFLLRKNTKNGEDQLLSFDLAELKIFPQEHRVDTQNQSLTVTPVQMRLLVAFNAFPNRLMSRDWLRFKVWNGEPISLRSIDAQISKLKKLFPTIDAHLESVYGKGYVWKTPTTKSHIS